MGYDHIPEPQRGERRVESGSIQSECGVEERGLGASAVSVPVPPRVRSGLNTTNQALGPTLVNDPTSDDTSGVSSAPIDALLYEAR